MKLIIAAGGTGGHLFPGLAVGEVFLARGHEVMLLISEKEIDSLATRGRDEFRIERVRGVGMQSKSPVALVKFALQFRAGLNQVKALYRDFQPDAVLGMGGFTSTAPILAGRSRKIPTFVHESNAIPGKANRLNGRLVTRVLLGFKECARFFPEGKCEVTGTPIRASLNVCLEKEKALAAFGLTPGRVTLLVMGGSQGAHGINQALMKALPDLACSTGFQPVGPAVVPTAPPETPVGTEAAVYGTSGGWRTGEKTGSHTDYKSVLRTGIQVIHLAGKQDEVALRESYAAAGIPAFVAAFHHRMEEAYSAADFAVVRSGAASLTELSHFALPAILIPYPHAAEDHQTFNAKIFENEGAGAVLQEREITGGILAKKLASFLDDPGLRAEASAASARLAPKQAAARVADTILKFCA